MAFKSCCSMTVCVKLRLERIASWSLLRQPWLQAIQAAICMHSVFRHFLGPLLHFVGRTNKQSMRSRVRNSEAGTSRNSSPTIAEHMITRLEMTAIHNGVEGMHLTDLIAEKPNNCISGKECTINSV